MGRAKKLMEGHINVTNKRSGKEFVVLVSYLEQEELLTVLAARKRAIALIRATEIGLTEYRIIKGLNPNFNPNSKGFGKKTQLKKDDVMSLGLLQLMRDTRPKFPSNINPIFGFKTQLPLIEYTIESSKLCLHIEDARDHAQKLLEASEACESDKFFDYFGEIASLDPEAINFLLSEFAQFRRKNRLEDLFDI